MAISIGSEVFGQQRDEVMDDTVDGRLAGVEERTERAGSQVGVQMDQYEQYPRAQRQSPGPTCARRRPMSDRSADGVDLALGERHQVLAGGVVSGRCRWVVVAYRP